MEKGTVYFFTGLAGAGKTTIGGLFYERLKVRKPDAVLLDGDKSRIKSGTTKRKDYSTEARRSGAYVQLGWCKEYADQGKDVVLCSISMYKDVRAWARENIENYKEIYVKVKWETLLRRNQKGLYSPGQKDVVGVDLPWDEPETPDIVIQNDGEETPEKIVNRIEQTLWEGKKTMYIS